MFGQRGRFLFVTSYETGKIEAAWLAWWQLLIFAPDLVIKRANTFQTGCLELRL